MYGRLLDELVRIGRAVGAGWTRGSARHPGAPGQPGARSLLLAPPRSRPWQAAGAGGAAGARDSARARSTRSPRPPSPRCTRACARSATGARPKRPADPSGRALFRPTILKRCRRFGGSCAICVPIAPATVGGLTCLVLATGFSLAIPWTVKEAVDALTAGASRGTLAAFAAVILGLALLHGVARLGSRFSMIGAGQWMEHDLRRDLYARFARAARRLLPRAPHRRPHVARHQRREQRAGPRRLRQRHAGADLDGLRRHPGRHGDHRPWLTLCALSPTPILIIAIKRFSQAVDDQSTAVQEQLGVLSAKVQENLSGMPVVRAYTMEAREIERFATAERGVPRRAAYAGAHPGRLLAAHGPGRRTGRARHPVARRSRRRRGPHHPRRLRRLQRLSRLPRLADGRAGLDPRRRPPWLELDAAHRRDPRRAGDQDASSPESAADWGKWGPALGPR